MVKIVIILILLSNFSQLIAEEEKQSSLFFGANVGYNLMEFYGFDNWRNWRHDFEFNKSIAFRIEYSLNKSNLNLYANSSFFSRSVDLPPVIYIQPYKPTNFENRSTEKYNYFLNDIGLKYNINILNKLNIFPKVGFYYPLRFNEKYNVNSDEYEFEEDEFSNHQIGFNVGGGISYKIHNIKMLLEYNYYDTFNEYNPEYRQAFIFSNHFHSLNFIIGYDFNFGVKK